jgi:hypothetical protein
MKKSGQRNGIETPTQKLHPVQYVDGMALFLLLGHPLQQGLQRVRIQVQLGPHRSNETNADRRHEARR